MFTTADKYWILFGILLYFPFHQLGFNIGLHKLFSHRQFKPVPWYPYLAVFIASICFFGNPIRNVLMHRLHHKYSDTDKDPHFPIWGRWHSFRSLFITHKPPDDSHRYLTDLDRDFKFLKKYKRIEPFVPLVFHTSTYLISPVLFLSCMFAALLSIYSALLINSFTHDPKIMKPVNNIILSNLFDNIYMHKHHHDNPSLLDNTHLGSNDYVSWFIKKFLMDKKAL